MNAKTISVGIEPDAIERFSKVTADQALEELIWNAIDAEASLIQVVLHRQQLQGIIRVVVADDGHGISIDDADKAFGSIGGSLKRLKRRSPRLDRPYHGKEGKGRYKAFSLGRHIEWHTRTLANGIVQSFSVELDAGNLKSARIGSPVPCDGTPGCEVIIENLREAASGLDNEVRLANIAHRLAPFLMANSGIRIVYDGTTLDIADAVSRDERLHIVDENDEDTPLSFDLNILEWHRARKGSLFWCDRNGVCFDETPLEMKGVRFSYSAYILSDEVPKLSDSGALAAGDLDNQVRRIKGLAREKLRAYFRQRQAEEAKHVAAKIRNEGIYPYSHFPSTPIEKAEQQVFDICAATVHEYLPQFDTADKSSRQFTYRLLREALESNPSNLSHIFKEVLKLSEEQQEHLVQLLAKTSLGAIIHSAKTVADRLTFINGLEQILHHKTIRKHLKERVQLQRILVEELWLFGDEYTLGCDDVSLKSVLQEHREVLGLPPLDVFDTGAVKDLTDVPDLLLWQQYLRGDGDRFEHLVIELKRPTVSISQTEIGQVKRYPSKVLANKYFDKDKTHWTFIALSDGIAADAEEDVKQMDREPGHVTRAPHHDIWVLTWSQVIQAAKIRLKWIQSRLEFEVTDNAEGMSFLRDRFSHLLPDSARKQSGEDA
jgi:hypothetical protein